MRKKAAGSFSTCDSPFLSFWSFNVSFTFLSFFGSIINVVFANTIISEVYVPCFISSLLHFYCKFVPEKKVTLCILSHICQKWKSTLFPILCPLYKDTSCVYTLFLLLKKQSTRQEYISPLKFLRATHICCILTNVFQESTNLLDDLMFLL